MTILLRGPRPTTPSRAGAGTTVRDWRAERRRRTRLTLAAGLVTIALIVGGVLTIVAAFQGEFSSYVDVRADLPIGNPIDPKGQVQFRQIPVGQVGRTLRKLPNGAVEVVLRIKPSKLGSIPANVTASVAPSSLFGTEAVVLDAAHPAAAHLRSGAHIPATGSTASLQGTLTDLNTLLTGLRPAEIDSTLSALSTAFNGQGPTISQSIRVLNTYLSGLVPELPTLNSDLDLLSPVLDGLSASVPALLDTAENSSTLAQTLTRDQALIASVMSDGATLSTTATNLLNAVHASLHSFLVNLAPILGDINGQPGVLPAILNAVQALSKAILPTLDQNGIRGLAASVTQFTNSPYMAFLGGLTAPGISEQERQQAAHNGFQAIMDPVTYTAANCPRYGADAGPNCPGASGQPTSPNSNPPGSASTTADTTQVSPDMQAASAQLLAAVDGRTAGSGSSTTPGSLWLAPLLGSLGS
jgi:phospholipid/cholesterol/gamma-HCH transport system substrate-binding protein